MAACTTTSTTRRLCIRTASAGRVVRVDRAVGPRRSRAVGPPRRPPAPRDRARFRRPSLRLGRRSPGGSLSPHLVARRSHERRASQFTATFVSRPVIAVGHRGTIQDMTETPEPSTQPTSVAAAPPPYARPKPPRLYVAAAWVVIVAGIVFILSTVFFAGAMVVGFSHHCYYKHHHGVTYGPGGPGGGPWQYGGPWGPGMAPPWGPSGGPGGPFGPGGPGGPGGPSLSPTPSAPAPAPNTPGNPRP
jgi:hypothetical protein